jgi:hypothetical protein
MTNLLSHHEIATLFVLYHASERMALADLDVLPLQHAHLVEVVSAESGHPFYTLMGGVAKRKELCTEPAASVAVEASERMHT